jgi:hypothetical protein
MLLLWEHLQAHAPHHVLRHVLHVLLPRHLSRAQQQLQLAPAATSAAASPPGAR